LRGIEGGNELNFTVSAYILPKRELNDVEEIKTYLKSKLI